MKKTLVFSKERIKCAEDLGKGGVVSYRDPSNLTTTIERCDLAVVRHDEANLSAIKDRYKDNLVVINQDILNALNNLDHGNNEHWTKSGKPSMSAVEKIIGYNISRADIEKHAPEFKRDM